MNSTHTTTTRWFVTDGGLETDLIFHHDLDLPEFAAFPLLDDPHGRKLLREYFEDYANIARYKGVALRLESPTWRASTRWGDRLGYDDAALRRVNGDAIRFLADIANQYDDLPAVEIVGMVGPRGDGYRPGSWDATHGKEDAWNYHRPQVEALANAGADVIGGYTLNDAAEAIGIIRAARDVGARVEIAFTVETDGRLATGLHLEETIAAVEADGGPDGYLLNCAHTDHIARAIDDPAVARRIVGLRPNASRQSHAELDEAEELDDGDPEDLAEGIAALCERLPSVRVIGGCCGTDARHVARMWDRLTSTSLTA